MNLFKNQTRVAMAYTNDVGDKVYPVIVDIKKGIKATEDILFVSSDINTGILSVAFIQGNDTYNVTGAEVVCSIMRPDASTLDIPCTVIENNIVEVPLGVNGTSQDGVYSFDFKVFKGGNKVVGTPIMNYSVSLSIGNDAVVEEDDRLPVLTMLMTQLTELKGEARETINQANAATVASREATTKAIEATNKANETVNKVTQDTASAIAEVNATAATMVENVNNAISSMDTTVNDKISEMTDTVNDKISEVNTTKNEMINDVSSTKANMVTEVTNAKNEMTATVTNKIQEVETRFNTLTSTQQQDAEVIDARTDFKGVVFDSLKERIDCTDKLLRDSTVSTVETESDFTTVEATSGGYFEDVKLEGKTLVNLATVKNASFEFMNGNPSNGVDVPLLKNIKGINTLIVNVKSNTLDKGIKVSFRAIDGTSIYPHGIPQGSLGNVSLLLNTKKNGIVYDVHTLRLYTDNSTSGNVEIDNIIILEGDHTQNPPNGYIEGLKSVGQSATTSEDGADEIVVSSVNENLFDKNNCTYNINGGGYYISNYININDKLYYDIYKNLNASKGVHYEFLDKNKKRIYINYNISYPQSGIIENTYDAKYIRLHMRHNTTITKEEIDNNYGVIVSSSPIKNINKPHQSDKKRLLYYNNETQSWEKPILREWDSIEKHADGKYYYHQRSGEVILNGTEDWRASATNDDTWKYLCFYANQLYEINGKPDCVLVCDKFIHYKGVEANNTGERISYQIINNRSGHAGKEFRIAIDRSKLSTQDAAGFKQWLQYNHITVVYELANEEVYECTNIDLITYANETNYIVESGAIAPKSILKVHNNISNVVKILQEKVSLLESNVKASQEVQDMMILETDMRMLDIELALMEFAPMKLNLGGSDMLRSATYFNFVKNHIINETYEKEYLENVMNKYLATGRINQDEYDELYKMLYPPVYDIELPIEL